MSTNRSTFSYDLTQLKKFVSEKNYAEIKKIILAAKQGKDLSWGDNDFVQDAIRDAIILGDIEAVKLFYTEGELSTTRPEYVDYRYRTKHNFICFAIKQRQLPIVEYAISDIPDFKSYSMEDSDPIFTAVEEGFFEIVAFLLSKGASARSFHNELYGRHDSVLTVAASRDDFATMEVLLSHGAYDDIEMSLESATREHSPIIEKCKNKLSRCDKSREQLYNQLESMRGTELFVKKLDEEIVTLKNNLYQSQTQYHKIFQNILDYAVGVDLSCSIEKYKDGLSILPKNVAGMNFCGVSINGKPITRDMLLAAKKEGVENAIFSISDVEQIKDPLRRVSIQNQLQGMFQKRGKLVDENGIVNLVPIRRAAEIGDATTLKFRLAAGCDPNECPIDEPKTHPLLNAARYGHEEIIKILLPHPALDKKVFRIAMDEASYYGHHSTVNLLFAAQHPDQLDDQGNALLHYAAKYGRVDETIKLINNNANVNLEGALGFPLHIAARNSKHDYIGYDTEQPSRCLTIMEILLNHNANPNTMHCDETAVHAFVRSFDLSREFLDSHRTIINRSIENGFEIDTKDKDGNTPLHIAAARGSVLMVQHLLSKNANPEIVNNNGRTPIVKAREMHEEEMRNIFFRRKNPEEQKKYNEEIAKVISSIEQAILSKNQPQEKNRNAAVFPTPAAKFTIPLISLFNLHGFFTRIIGKQNPQSTQPEPKKLCHNADINESPASRPTNH